MSRENVERMLMGGQETEVLVTRIRDLIEEELPEKNILRDSEDTGCPRRDSGMASDRLAWAVVDLLRGLQ
jgi:hypothetical protein